MDLSNCTIIIKLGDITQEDSEGIVNAANSGLLGGGGVDGAIHRAGGPSIMRECERIRELKGGCPTGTAVLTDAGNLKAKKVIHTVGPVWKGGSHKEAQLLASAYHHSLLLAHEHGLSSLSFPSISTGVYGYPIEKAAPIALSTTVDFINSTPDLSLKEVRFVLFSSSDLSVYKKYEESL